MGNACNNIKKKKKIQSHTNVWHRKSKIHKSFKAQKLQRQTKNKQKDLS